MLGSTVQAESSQDTAIVDGVAYTEKELIDELNKRFSEKYGVDFAEIADTPLKDTEKEMPSFATFAEVEEALQEIQRNQQLGEKEEAARKLSNMLRANGSVSWYSPLCGGFGGWFCWKHISYSYVCNGNLGYADVTNSWITGYQIAWSWTHNWGNAVPYLPGNGQPITEYTLHAHGTWVLGIQIQGFQIGASWPGSWSRYVNVGC